MEEVQTMPKTLYPSQATHSERLFEILQENKVACDTSATGSGKTIVAVKMAVRLGLPMVVVGPPTLRPNWQTACTEEGVQFIFMSSSAIVASTSFSSFLLVADEFHLFKNASQRNVKLARLQSKATYTLLLSATLVDHPRQYINVSKFIGVREIADLCNTIEYTHPTKVSHFLYHVYQTSDESKLYSDGRRLIAQATSGEREEGFRPGLFQKGFQSIHASLLQGLIRYVEKTKDSVPNEKLIISMKYKEHFRLFIEKFPEALVLNGDTSYADRKRVIAAFQEPNTKHKLLVLTDVVGGVGIDLDDQHGAYPRRVVCMPSFATDFLQLVGRVKRRTSKSDARVFVLQPHLTNTYFTRQIETKGPVLGQFNRAFSVEMFKREVEHAPDCPAHFGGVLVEKYIDMIIKEFACECLPPKSKFVPRKAKMRAPPAV